MGRRRDKVRWSQVDLHQEKTPSVPIVPPQKVYSIQQKPPTELSGDRRYSHRRQYSSLAPRFAKKSSRTEAINSKEADCSVEELPDGYIKIRSKNLDIIFKKEFYHKRMMELQVRGITPNKIKEEWNDASLSKSSSMNIPGNSEDPVSVTVASTLSFNDLDLDEIPEFRPRLGTDGGSINDSGYSSSFQESFCYDQQPQYPPLPGPVFLPPPNLPPPPLASQQMCPFFLFSPATNTLIPCEEVLVHKSLDTPGGQVFQGYTKAYVAYPVQGPEGRGYVMQPFSVPPELSSSPEREKIEGDSEVVKEDEFDSSYKEVLTKSSSQLEPEERTPKIGHVILPNVYIPGLPPSEMRAKKKRRKKPKAKSDQAPRLPSSSESDAKEFEPVNYPRAPETEELYEFIKEEPVNEINLTDDLTNSLLNPPTEDEEIESSALAREILHLVETDEDTPVEVAPRVETEELVEEHNPADAVESEAKGDIKPTKETIVNPKPKLTKPQTKQTQKKLKKKPEPKIAHLMDVLSSLQTSTSAPALVNDQEDQNIVEQGHDPEASSNAFTEEETKSKQDAIPAKINETEDKLEKVEETTATENRGCLVSDIDELCLLEEAEHWPPPNVPAARSKVRDSKGRRRKKRSSKEVNGEENPSKKVLVMDNQVDDFHNALVRGCKESVVWIKELGYGMDRGVMELERLFQGHYVPPARGEYAMKEEKEVESVMIDTLEVE